MAFPIMAVLQGITLAMRVVDNVREPGPSKKQKVIAAIPDILAMAGVAEDVTQQRLLSHPKVQETLSAYIDANKALQKALADAAQ